MSEKFSSGTKNSKQTQDIEHTCNKILNTQHGIAYTLQDIEYKSQGFSYKATLYTLYLKKLC